MSSKVIKLIPCLFVAVLLCSCGADKHVKQGEKHLALGEYFDAATQFKQAYQQTTPKDKVKRGKIALKMARCYSKSLQTAKAVAAYRNAERYHQMRAGDMLDFAQLLLKQANYKEAQRVFTQLEDSLPGNEMVQTGLTSARMAPTWKEQGSRYTVKKMSVFNSRRADYSPMLLGDEANLLYFTSTRNEAQGDELSGITGTKAGDIFYSEKDDKGKWQANVSYPMRDRSVLSTVCTDCYIRQTGCSVVEGERVESYSRHTFEYCSPSCFARW